MQCAFTPIAVMTSSGQAAAASCKTSPELSPSHSFDGWTCWPLGLADRNFRNKTYPILAERERVPLSVVSCDTYETNDKIARVNLDQSRQSLSLS